MLKKLLSNKIVLICLAAVVILGAIILLTQNGSRPSPTSSPSPTSTPSQSIDQAMVKQLSKEFLAKYYNYSSPASSEYLASIKPYLEPSLSERISEENQKLKNAKALHCTTEKLDVRADGNNTAITEATLRCTEVGTTEPFTKTIAISWEDNDGRLQVTKVALLETTKKYPYLDK